MENSSTIQALASVPKSGKSRRGFASMDKERHKSVSSKGGKSIRSNYSNRHLDPTPETSNLTPITD